VDDARKRTYQSFSSMRYRCFVPKSNEYHNYGGRGITVCERWNNFENFLSDMGFRPEKLTLERIDNNGNYEPSNCRWATRKEQRHNQRSCHYLEHNGERKPLREWARIGGICEHTFLRRIRRGWSVERAMTEKVNPNRARAGLKGCMVRYRSLASAQS
jgi:hypothetical protein